MGSHPTRAAAVLGVLVVATGCSPVHVRAPAIPDESRTETRLPSYRTWVCREASDGTIFRWSAGTVPLTCRAALWFLPQFRRVTVIASDGVSSDEFMLDTGTARSTLSMSSPLARSLRFPRSREQGTVVRIPGHPGGREAVVAPTTTIEFGVLPRLRLGPVEGENLLLGATSNSGSRANPANILGLDVLQGAALVRSDDGWRIETGPRTPWPGASIVRLEQIGLPVVSMTDASGRVVRALIDTGAPKCFAFDSAGTAPWSLVAADGRTVIDTRASMDVGDPGDAMLTFGGVRLDFGIGLDVLDRGTWRIDFERGVWEFAR